MKLSDAIRDWDSMDMDEGIEPEATLLKAAITQNVLHKAIDLDRLDDALEFGHVTDQDGAYLIHIAEQVRAALTPGDTNE